MRKERIFIFGVVIIVAISYARMLSGFFQQDEWLSFGYRFLSAGQGITDIFKDAFVPSVGHYQPLTTLSLYAFFFIFGTNYVPYAIVSLILHLVAVLLVYNLTKMILGDWKAAALSSLIFGVGAASYQATSWVMADTSIHFSTLLSLISLIVFMRFLERQKLSYFISALVLLLVSLLFKEITLGFFALFIILFYLFAEKSLRRQKIYPTIIIFVGLSYLLFRVTMVFLPQAYSKDTIITTTQPLIYLFYNVFTFPFKGISQTIIPSGVLYNFSRFVAGFFPTSFAGEPATLQFDRFVEQRVLEVMSFLLFVGISFFVLPFWKRWKDGILKKAMLLGFFISFLNSSIFALSPEKRGIITIIDSRNLYLVSIGVSILIVSLVYLIFSKRKLLGIYITLASIIIVNFYLLNDNLYKVTRVGSLRKDLLTEIKRKYPKLPSKVIFYSESDSSYYGLAAEEKIMPFQSGFGQTLLVWYQQSEKFPKDFYKDRFLWEIKSQGYKEEGGRGFGYFRNYDLLTKTLEDYNLQVDSIIAFSWKAKNETLRDITNVIKENK